MILYTIGFTKKTAQQFFELIRENNVKIIIDVRLNNVSQLSGFAKGNDLKYFLNKLCECDYEHYTELAPTKEILDGYKSKKMDWNEYETQYNSLIKDRGIINGFLEKYDKYTKIGLLCSEPTVENCHRRLLAEMIAIEHPQIVIKHI
ncbi:MAG: DUF488 domain-containing protein [Defluviitaleaceae bacterium]|nr:DUF488 domain-containing protein [Defluviitaleaceae bacterium]